MNRSANVGSRKRPDTEKRCRHPLRGILSTGSGLETAICQNGAIHFSGGKSMKVLIDLCVVPLGVGVSVSKYIAACQRVLSDAGLKTHLHSYGTNIEGEWDDVFAAVRKCHETLHEMGAPRISTTIKLGTRTDRDQSMEEKVRSVQEKI
jgi:uncharacterized protein (TIGR00106 family)